MNSKKTRLRYALDRYVCSLTTAITEQDAEKLMIPEIVMVDEFFEDDKDGE